MKTQHLIAIVALLTVIMLGWFFYKNQVTMQNSAKSVTPSPSSGQAVNSESDLLRGLLLDSAYVTIPEVQPETTVKLEGSVTEFGDFENDPEQLYGTVALGPDVLGDTTLIFAITGFNMGGSGDFIYVTAFVPGEGGYRGAAYESLGDRVQIDSFSSNGNTVTVKYRVHGPDQAMAEDPTQAEELVLIYENGAFTQAPLAE